MLILDFIFFGIAFQGFFLAVLLHFKLKEWKVGAYYFTFSMVLLTWVLIWVGKHGLSGSALGTNWPDFSLLLGPLLVTSINNKKTETVANIAFFCFGSYFLTGFFIQDFYHDMSVYTSFVSIFLNSAFLLIALKRIDFRGAKLMSFALMAFIVYMVVFLLLSYLGLLTWIIDYCTALIISCFFYVSGYQYLLRSNFRSRKHKETLKHQLILNEALHHLEKSQKYLKPDYRFIDLARDLDVSEAQLSEVIRCSKYDNFKSLINHFRINYSKKLLLDSDLKVLAVAMESGFNNKVSFNTNFKKFTGTSPASYREHIKG